MVPSGSKSIGMVTPICLAPYSLRLLAKFTAAAASPREASSRCLS